MGVTQPLGATPQCWLTGYACLLFLIFFILDRIRCKELKRVYVAINTKQLIDRLRIQTLDRRDRRRKD